MSRVFIGTILWLMCLHCLPTQCLAQDGPLGGLLRDLIESELQRRQTDLRTPLGPRQPQPQRPPQVEFARNQREAQRFCNSFATEANRLVGLCQSEARRIPGLHNHLDELQKVSALARQMNLDFAKPLPEPVIIDELQRLDREWRLSKYHIQQTRGLPNSFDQPIARMDQFLTQGCQLYDIGPTVNGHVLVRSFESLSAELNHLERDLRYVRAAEVRNLALEVGRLRSRAHLMAESVRAGDSYDAVVAEFQAFSSDWSAVRNQLDRLQDAYLARSVEQIQILDSQIREHLWLPRNVDQGHLQHLSGLLQGSTTAYINSINLRVLLEAKNAQQILRVAGNLEREVGEYCELANGGRSQDELVRAWEQFDRAWREMDQLIRPIERPRTSEYRLKLVSELSAIRNSLGIQLIFDRDQVRRYAAKLEGIADQQLFHVAQWQKRPNAELNPATVASLDQFVRDCKQLHRDCARNFPQQQLYDRCNQITQNWVTLRPQLARCKTVDRNAVLRVSDSLTECLVHLQTLLQI